MLTFSYKIGYPAFNVGAALPIPAVRDGLAEPFMDEGDVLAMTATETDTRNRTLLRFMHESGCRVF